MKKLLVCVALFSFTAGATSREPTHDGKTEDSPPTASAPTTTDASAGATHESPKPVKKVAKKKGQKPIKLYPAPLRNNP